MSKVKVNKVPMRNHLVLVARQRHAGYMKHSALPRGGVRNESRDLMDEYYDEYDDE